MGRRLEDDGPGSVGEEGRGPSVVPVGDPRQGVGADEQHSLGAHGDEPVRVDEAVDEARAGGVELEGAAGQSKVALDDRSGAPLAVGVVVATTRASMRSGVSPAISIAARPDSTESEAVEPPIRRSEIPVRATIHSSLVSSVFSRSWLVTTFSGSAVPQPEMTAPVAPGRVAGIWSPPRRPSWADRLFHPRWDDPHEVRSHAIGCLGATRSVSAAM